MNRPRGFRSSLRRVAARIEEKAETFSFASRLSDQRGFALILALSMLVLLSIIGVVALSNSSTELGISGNYQAGAQAFNAADRALGYAMVNAPALANGADNYALFSTASGQGIQDDTGVNVNGSGLYRSTADGENYMTFIAEGAAPPGSGSDATVGSGFKAYYFVIRVEGAYPANASNPSRCKLETQFAQIVPE